MKPEIKLRISGDPQLTFRYVNWRGEEHEYVVLPESMALGLYNPDGAPTGHDVSLQWVLHAMVLTRDGHSRPVRRTFILEKIEDLTMQPWQPWNQPII